MHNSEGKGGGVTPTHTGEIRGRRGSDNVGGELGLFVQTAVGSAG